MDQTWNSAGVVGFSRFILMLMRHVRIGAIRVRQLSMIIKT